MIRGFIHLYFTDLSIKDCFHYKILLLSTIISIISFHGEHDLLFVPTNHINHHHSILAQQEDEEKEEKIIDGDEKEKVGWM